MAIWRRFLRHIGLQGKLVLFFSLLLMAAMALAFWLLVDRSRAAVSDILGEQARQIAQTLAMAARRPCQAKDSAELRELARTVLNGRNIALVAFYDARGKPLAVVSRDPAFAAELASVPAELLLPQQLMRVRQRQLPALGDFLEVSAPILADGAYPGSASRLVGYLTIGISQNSERAELNRVTVLAIALGALVFLAWLPLVRGMVQRVFVPIRDLIDATSRISRGHYDAQVPTDRPDEIGQLARAFNRMVERIREHQHALEQANRGLEQKVQQRTGELEATNHRLVAEIAEKEDFLRAVSHDLNAPLRNIDGMAGMLLLKGRDRLDGDTTHRLERIRRNVRIGSDLISELLELSRIKTRRQKMELVDIDALVRELAEVFDEDLRQRSIALVIESPLPMLHCERSRLRQVFQNLIDNAIKYMGDGAGREIRVGCVERPEALEFFVSDTGIGIDGEDIGRLFCVFRRGKNSHEMNVPGKGVGLASVKSIIETYDGRIWAESRPGQGSAFRFTIPRRFAVAGDGMKGAA